MMSTPVRSSMERIFRPSRPMILPFTSSLGRFTTDTVFSLVYLPEYLWMARDIMSFALRSAEELQSSSICLSLFAASYLASFSTRLTSSAFAASRVRPDISSIFPFISSIFSSRVFCLCSAVRFLLSSSAWIFSSSDSFSLICSYFLLSPSSFAFIFFSVAENSLRFSLDILCIWEFLSLTSFFALFSALFLISSACFSAPSIIVRACCRLLLISFFSIIIL